MNTQYAATAARALATIRRKGAPVAFTFLRGDGTYLADLDVETYAGPVTVSGYAVRGETQQFGSAPVVQQSQTLAETERPTLLFAPSVQGQQPEIGMLVVWGGHTYSVKAVDAIASDGDAIVCTVVVSR